MNPFAQEFVVGKMWMQEGIKASRSDSSANPKADPDVPLSESQDEDVVLVDLAIPGLKEKDSGVVKIETGVDNSSVNSKLSEPPTPVWGKMSFVDILADEVVQAVSSDGKPAVDGIGNDWEEVDGTSGTSGSGPGSISSSAHSAGATKKRKYPGRNHNRRQGKSGPKIIINSQGDSSKMQGQIVSNFEVSPKDDGFILVKRKVRSVSKWLEAERKKDEARERSQYARRSDIRRAGRVDGGKSGRRMKMTSEYSMDGHDSQFGHTVSVY